MLKGVSKTATAKEENEMSALILLDTDISDDNALHAPDCQHIGRDRKRLARQAGVEDANLTDFYNLEDLAYYMGSYEIASDMYEPGTLEHRMEAQMQAMDAVNVAPCAEHTFNSWK